jgi:predicted RND superfamily exporter protein
VREHCRKIADSYFGNLEEFIKKRMGKLTSEQSELIVEMDRVSNIIAELKLLLNKLDNNRAFLQSAETVVKLDG